MKKNLFLIAVAITSISLNAQIHSVGLRMNPMSQLGEFAGIGEITVQLEAFDGRIEANLGLNKQVKEITGTYQLAHDLPGAFSWYYGAGVTFGIRTFDSNGINLGLLGIGGLEYNFDFPLQAFADYRPTLYLINGPNVGVLDLVAFGVGARYRFD